MYAYYSKPTAYHQYDSPPLHQIAGEAVVSDPFARVHIQGRENLTGWGISHMGLEDILDDARHQGERYLQRSTRHGPG